VVAKEAVTVEAMVVAEMEGVKAEELKEVLEVLEVVVTSSCESGHVAVRTMVAGYSGVYCRRNVVRHTVTHISMSSIIVPQYITHVLTQQ
jgi:hypothetical protein